MSDFERARRIKAAHDEHAPAMLRAFREGARDFRVWLPPTQVAYLPVDADISDPFTTDPLDIVTFTYRPVPGEPLIEVLAEGRRVAVWTR